MMRSIWQELTAGYSDCFKNAPTMPLQPDATLPWLHRPKRDAALNVENSHQASMWHASVIRGRALCLCRGLQKTLQLSCDTAAAQSSPLRDHDMMHLRRTSVDVVHSAQDECRGWDVNEIVFGPAMWPTYHSLMRADFTLFDEYQYQHAGWVTRHMPDCLA